jgi:hypothetical protein
MRTKRKHIPRDVVLPFFSRIMDDTSVAMCRRPFFRSPPF